MVFNGKKEVVIVTFVCSMTFGWRYTQPFGILESFLLQFYLGF